MPTASRRRFYFLVFEHMWGLRMVPKAAELADWLAAQPFENPPEDLPLMIERLRAWPEGRNYPIFPDDEALSAGIDAKISEKWWTPGALAGEPQRRAVRALMDQSSSES